MVMAERTLSLAHVEARLRSHRARDGWRILSPHRRAAVAMVLRFERDAGPELLLMKRAKAAGDRWSGHVSLPGGREEEVDADLAATAVRETHEELGIDLSSSARLLGRGDAVRAVARGKILPFTITPFVFAQTRAAPLELGVEAADAFWLPLDRAVSGDLASRYSWRLGPVRIPMPSWRVGDHEVWGLTYKMIRELLDVLA